MQSTSALEKLGASAINVFFVLLMFLPFYIKLDDTLVKKVVFIGLFWIHNLIFLFLNNGRDLGMILLRTRYAQNYSKFQLFIYDILYTLSFSTLLFWIWFPFDLFLANMLLIQLPTIAFTKTTLHGYLAGKVTTVSD